MRIFYEEWRMLDNYNSAVETAEFTQINANSSVRTDEMPNNSAVQTAELQTEEEIRQLQLTNLPDFPVKELKKLL